MDVVVTVVMPLNSVKTTSFLAIEVITQKNGLNYLSR